MIRPSQKGKRKTNPAGVARQAASIAMKEAQQAQQTAADLANNESSLQPDERSAGDSPDVEATMERTVVPPNCTSSEPTITRRMSLATETSDLKTSMKPLQEPAKCYLQTITPELRNVIYELAFTSSGAEEIHLLKEPPPSNALLLTSRQIYQEAVGLYTEAYRRFWKTSSFVVDEDETVPGGTKLWARFNARDMQHVSRLTLRKRSRGTSSVRADGIWTHAWKNDRMGVDGHAERVLITEEILNLCRQSGGPVHHLVQWGNTTYAMDGRRVETWTVALYPNSSMLNDTEAREVRQWVADTTLPFCVDELALVLWMWKDRCGDAISVKMCD